MVSVSVRYLFYQPIDEKIKTWTLRFPAKETLLWRWHCSIGQSCCSMTSKRSISWFPESSRAWRFFTRAFAQPTKSHARLYSFDKPINCFCSVRASLFLGHTKIALMLIYDPVYDETLLSGQPLLSGHLPVPRVAALWKFNVKENVKKLQV